MQTWHTLLLSAETHTFVDSYYAQSAADAEDCGRNQKETCTKR